MKRLIRRQFWGRIWAFLVATAGLLAGILGPWGYWDYLTAAGKHPSAADLAYLTLQLFFLNGESLNSPVPPLLQEARFLAAFVALSTVIAALLQLFHTRIHLLRARLNRGHIVVCGLHPRRLGLVEALRRRRKKVVVLMPEAHAEGVARCRYAGAVVVTGYAIDGWLLGRVHLRRAKALLALSPDDETNIRAALLARQVPRRRQDGLLKCVVEVSDVDLRQQLAQLNFGGWADNPFDLELINPFDIAAHVLWAEAIRLCGDHMPRRLLVVGLGRLGEALVLRAAREWLIEEGEDRGTPRRHIAIVDREAPQRERHLRDAHSFVGQACDLARLTVDVQDSAFARGLPGLCAGTDAVDAAFVCLENEVSGLLAALVLSQEPKLKATPTLLQIAGKEGLAMKIGHGEGARIHPVSMEEIYQSPDLVLDATCEVLARVIHEQYLWNELKRGTFKADKLSHRPWPPLDEQYKNSNRGQARHILHKLSLLGCRLVPAPGIGSSSEPGTLFEFSKDEVERLAREEHERWCAETDEKHPARVPWDQLDEENRNRDRDAVREIPALVARVGLGIVRRPQTGGAPGQVAAAEPSPAQPECLVAPS
jgi:hypothetical protein